MKTLHLMRHADASRAQSGASDRERELGPRGRREALQAGERLGKLLSPSPVHCSAALRTRQTLAELCTGWPELAGKPHRIEEDLYTFSVDDLLDWLVAQPAERDSLFLLGHNPALTELVNLLAPGAELSNLPTAGYVQLRLSTNHWEALPDTVGELSLYLFPEA